MKALTEKEGITVTDKRQNDSILIVLPLDGEIVPIDQVPDPIFSGRMMGDGAAVIPENGKIVAPWMAPSA